METLKVSSANPKPQKRCRLFDEQADRSYTGSAPHSEPSITYLNRSGRKDAAKVRQVLDAWFSRYPRRVRMELRKRLLSDDQRQQLGAYFELFLHELLLRLGCHVKLHPRVSEGRKTRPDFRVDPPDGKSFYLEATVVGSESLFRVDDERRVCRMLDELNRLLRSRYYRLALAMEDVPKANVSTSAIARILNGYLRQLDATTDSARGATDTLWKNTCWACPDGGWDATFSPFPKPAAMRGTVDGRTISTYSTPVMHLEHGRLIRKAIKDKGGHYGRLRLPYVIAVNVLYPGVKHDEIMEALFGPEEYVYTTDGRTMSKPEFRRKRDGVWVDHRGPLYRRVSAVLVGSPVMIWNVPRSQMCLYHNPWARSKYASVLCRLPQAVPGADHRMHPRRGKDLHKIFGLEQGWPGPPE